MKHTSLLFLVTVLLLSSACNRKSKKAVSVDTIETTETLVIDTNEEYDPTTIGASGEDGPAVIEEQVEEIEVIEIEKITTPYLVASIKKTPCYGTCPSYEAQLFSDGRMVYRGKTNTDKIGLYEARAHPGFIPRLLEESKNLNYFEHAITYPKDGHLIADLPLVVTFVNDGTREKKVTNNYLSPKNLKLFESFLDELFLSANWKRVEGQR